MNGLFGYKQRSISAQDIFNNKQSMLMSVKSDKGTKLSNLDLDQNRPFRRKQNVNNVLKKSRCQEVGKLISNTSFEGSPDLRIIFSPQPRQHAKKLQQKQQKFFNRGQLKNCKSETDLNKLPSNNKASSSKLLGPLQNINNRKFEHVNETMKIENKSANSQNKSLKMEVKILTMDKKQLQQKNNQLQKKISYLQTLIVEKDSHITQMNAQIMRKIQQFQQQKQINKCLQQIITKLNAKIEQLTEIQIKQRKEYLDNNNQNQNKTQLEHEVEKLRQQVYNLNKSLHSFQIQKIILQKIRYEMEQYKNTNHSLQKQNRLLRQRIVSVIKLNRIKVAKSPNGKKSLKKQRQLQYSVSFSFQD